MATSAVAICSNALLLLGQGSINSFDEDSTGLCANLWDTVRTATLRLGTWSCARKRVSLPALATAPAFGWTYQHQLPSDLLRVVSVGEWDESHEYEIEDGKLLSDESPILLRYVYDNTTVQTWDALLTEAATLHMAALMAYPITKSETTRQSMEANFAALLKNARGVNGSEAPVDRVGDLPLFTSRARSR